MANENLKQTASSFKFIGKVGSLDKDGAFKEEVASRGKNEGKTYRSLRFSVQTSETNRMMVEMFDFEPEKVFLWNSKLKKENEAYKGEWIPFSSWERDQEELSEQGYTVFQTRVGFDYDKNGKLITKGLPSYVASEMIFENLTNGDNVVVEGEIRYSTYQNKEGKEVKKTQYIIKKLYKLKNDVDFDAKDFEETTYFEQEIVYVGADVEKKEKKAYVTGRVIDYQGNFNDVQMVVDFSDGKDGTDEGMVKLTQTFLKKIKFGDTLNLFGDTVNRVIVEEVEGEEEDEEDWSKLLGGKAKPKHAQKFTAKSYISEMRVNGAEDLKRGVYTEEDFVKDELIEDEFDLGGKAKPKKNPFDFNDDDSELPF